MKNKVGPNDFGFDVMKVLGKEINNKLLGGGGNTPFQYMD